MKLASSVVGAFGEFIMSGDWHRSVSPPALGVPGTMTIAGANLQRTSDPFTNGPPKMVMLVFPVLGPEAGDTALKSGSGAKGALGG